MAYKVGVIIGRFQTPRLHKAHRELFKRAIKENDDVLVLIGDSPLKSTGRNPLTYNQRALMICKKFNVACLGLKDCRSDKEWSREVDKLINADLGEEEITLYGGRDSFIPYYTGKHTCVEVEELPDVSATKLRKNVPTTGGRKYREGVCFGAKNRWNNAVPCVDVAIMDGGMVLLGRKKDEKEYRFIGGFVDAEESYEHAALREVKEETQLDVHCLTYLGSYVIDDWRYRGEVVKVTTSFFSARYKRGYARASDDIEEVRWFKLRGDIDIIEGHKGMLQILRGVYSP